MDTSQPKKPTVHGQVPTEYRNNHRQCVCQHINYDDCAIQTGQRDGTCVLGHGIPNTCKRTTKTMTPSHNRAQRTQHFNNNRRQPGQNRRRKRASPLQGHATATQNTDQLIGWMLSGQETRKIRGLSPKENRSEEKASQYRNRTTPETLHVIRRALAHGH